MNYISTITRFAVAQWGESVVIMQDDGSEYYFAIKELPMGDSTFWELAGRLIDEVGVDYPGATYSFTHH